MGDSQMHETMNGISRSWPWFVAAGGGLLVYGLISLASALFVAVVVDTRDLALFFELLSLPMGVLAVLCGYQLIRVARILADSSGGRGIEFSADFFRRLRLAAIFGGSLSLVLLFVIVSNFMRLHVLTP